MLKETLVLGERNAQNCIFTSNGPAWDVGVGADTGSKVQEPGASRGRGPAADRAHASPGRRATSFLDVFVTPLCSSRNGQMRVLYHRVLLYLGIFGSTFLAKTPTHLKAGIMFTPAPQSSTEGRFLNLQLLTLWPENPVGGRPVPAGCPPSGCQQRPSPCCDRQKCLQASSSVPVLCVCV